LLPHGIFERVCPLEKMNDLFDVGPFVGWAFRASKGFAIILMAK